MKIPALLKLSLILSLIWFTSNLSAQGQTVGNVIDEADRTPISNVTITVGLYKTRTDFMGKFSLSTPKDSITKYGVLFSSIGYAKKKITTINGLKLVKLNKETLVLNELVFSAEKPLIRRVIDNIPKNYMAQPFMVKGILRIYHLDSAAATTNSLYENSAIVDVYHPGYHLKNKKIEVALVQNKSNTYRIERQDEDNMRWVNGYLVPTYDLVKSKSSVLDLKKIRDYHFKVEDTINFKGYKAFVLNFISKKNNNYKGTLFIDTNSLAIIAAKFITVDLKPLLRNSMRYKTNYIEYKATKVGWYMTQHHIFTQYRDEKYTFRVDYIANELDTVNVNPLKYAEVIQRYTQDIKINNMGTDSLWKKYEGKFKSLEDAGELTKIEIPKATIADSLASKKRNNMKKNLAKVINYLSNDNIRLVLRIGKTPITFASNQTILDKDLKDISNYTVGATYQFRLYQNLFFNLAGNSNYGLGGIRNATSSYQLTYGIETNKKGHVITFWPSFGYSKNVIAIKEEEYFNAKYLTTGLDLSYEITRRHRLFSGLEYAHQFSQVNKGLVLKVGKFYPSIGFTYSIR